MCFAAVHGFFRCVGIFERRQIVCRQTDRRCTFLREIPETQVKIYIAFNAGNGSFAGILPHIIIVDVSGAVAVFSEPHRDLLQTRQIEFIERCALILIVHRLVAERFHILTICKDTVCQCIDRHIIGACALCIVINDLPVEDDRKIKLCTAQQFGSIDRFCNCFFFGNCLREEICTDQQTRFLCTVIILPEACIRIHGICTNAVIAVTDPEHDEINTVCFDGIPVCDLIMNGNVDARHGIQIAVFIEGDHSAVVQLFDVLKRMRGKGDIFEHREPDLPVSRIGEQDLMTAPCVIMGDICRLVNGFFPVCVFRFLQR